MKKLTFALITMILLNSCEFKVNVKKGDNPLDTKTQNADSLKSTLSLPFPLKTGFSNEYLRATFWKCNYSSAGTMHAYWVILPNTMRATSVKPAIIEGLDMTNIGTCNTIDKTLPYIEVNVAYETVKDLIDPSEWLLKKAGMMGETVLQKNEFKYEDGQKNLDVLTYKVTRDGERVISRFVGQKKGNEYYLLKASCSEHDYISQANNIFYVVSHWGTKDVPSKRIK